MEKLFNTTSAYIITCTAVKCTFQIKHKHATSTSIHKLNSLDKKRNGNICGWWSACTKRAGGFCDKLEFLVSDFGPQCQNAAVKSPKTSPAWEVGVLLFIMAVNSLALQPTESKHFCFPEKCAREEKKQQKKALYTTQQRNPHQQQKSLPQHPQRSREEKTKLYLSRLFPRTIRTYSTER